MPYQHLAAITGSAAAAEILRDICGRMKLNGGADHDGHHWVYVSAREAAEAANCCRNYAAKLLSCLEELGLVIREKIGVAVGLPWVRSWFYRPGPECPDWLISHHGKNSCAAGDVSEKGQNSSSSKALPVRVATDCPRGEQSIQQPTSTPNNKNRAANAQKEQPHNIPGLDQTAALLERIRQWPKATPPSETQKTQIVAESSFVWDPSGHGRKQHQAKTTAPQGFGTREGHSSPVALADRARGDHQSTDPLRETAGSIVPSVARGGMMGADRHHP